MKNIKIGKNKIGLNYRPYIIVEACVNHQGNFDIAKNLDNLRLKKGVHNIYFNMIRCYTLLCKKKIIDKKELSLLNHWISDLKNLNNIKYDIKKR